MSLSLQDAEARRRAVTDLDENWVVTAGAGTGKTSLLVERTLFLLLSERCSLAEIRALTFTEKAAAEMKRRLAEALEETQRLVSLPSFPETLPGSEAGRVLALLPRSGWSRLAEPARAAHQDLDRAAIGTLHAFCTDLLRRHPREAGLPPEVTIEEDVVFGPFFDELWGEFLQNELGPGGTRPALWSRVLQRFPIEDVEDAARRIFQRPAVRDLLVREAPRARDAREYFAEEAGLLAVRLREVAPLVTARGGKLRLFLSTAAGLLDIFRAKGVEALRDQDVQSLEFPEIWDHSGNLSAGKDNPQEAEILKVAAEARTLLQGLYRLQEEEITLLLTALRPLAERHRTRVLQEGRLSFDDLLLFARDLLRDMPDLRRDEARRFRALLVDEFQDTDPLQYEIVFYLAASARSAERDAYAVPLEPGRLFIVGDPKQSIYRFRGADMTAYRRAVNHVLEQGQAASLTVSFRSVPEVLDPVNALFDGWIGEIPDRGVDPPYERIHPCHARGKPGVGVEIWSVHSPWGRAADLRRAAEGAVIAQTIRRWIDEEGLAPKEIAILFRALTDIPLTTRALRRAGIEFVVEGGRAFAERPEVVESLALLRALGNPGDPVPILGVLRSTFGGLTDAELAEYVHGGGAFSWETARSGNPPRVEAVFARLRALEDQRRRLPLDRWIHLVLTESEFLLLQAAYEDGSQRQANVRKLAERAAGLVRNGGLTLEEAIEELEDVLGGNRAEGESPLADEALDAVRILSIHKAKGLEFRAVLVPDLGRVSPPRGAETRIDVHRPGPAPAIAVEFPGRVRNVAGLAQERERARHEEAEAKRLLYVAATRARDRLIFLNSSTRKPTAWVRALHRWGYEIDSPAADFPPEGLLESGVRHRLLEPALISARREPGDAMDPVSLHRRLLEARNLAQAPRPARFRNPSHDHRLRVADRETGWEHRGTSARDLQRGVGVAVHRLLERWDFRDATPLRDAVPGAAAQVARSFRLDVSRVAKETAQVIEGFLVSGTPAYLAGSEILGREVPILAPDESGQVVVGYADLVYRRQDRIHVADYKTDADTTDIRAAAYREQLAEYGRAVTAALGLAAPALTEVIFVRNGRRILLHEEIAP